ncbi:thiol reductant ABC exporter subunit CydC, partial [Streptomyces sp. B1866]|uniref:thiol reductant ABC exporter subunit CydC n=1 Tax=Streptomyces sp. B1866 TaxID=3075431 RepID=UPI0028911BA0
AAARRADAALTAIARRSAAATALGAGLTALACGLTVTGTAWAGVRAVADGRLAGVWLAVVVLTPLAAFEAVAGLPSAVQYRQRVRRSAERVYEVLDRPSAVAAARTDRAGAPVPAARTDAARRAGPATPATWRPEAPEAARAPGTPGTPGTAEAPGTPGTPFPLVLRGISARHPGRPGQPAPPLALDGVDLDLRPGRRVAVVGPSGAGKTTLAHVLLRFLDAESGTYTLGGRDAAAMDDDEVRRLVGLCAQDAHIFDSTLRENLRLALPREKAAAGDAVLRDALRAARLLDWVDGLPHGLDTRVGESGTRLSGGQRQRLALARALLAGFPVLVLDEPAEHLDLPTADALTADLLAATQGRTTVLITHRLTGLEAVDEVVVLSGGRVVQRGPYERLAACDGPFRRTLERERATAAYGEDLAVAG